MAIPRLTRRYGNPAVLVGGVAISVIGMAWLSRLGPDTAYLTGIALPMALIGIGQGGSLGPLTGDDTLEGAALLAHRISASLTAAAVLLALALATAVAVRPRGTRRLTLHRSDTRHGAGTVILAPDSFSRSMELMDVTGRRH